MPNALERWFDRRQQLTPFRDFSQIQESFDRLFNEFMNLKKTNGLQEFGFSPSCEIAEEGNNYVLTFDLPGVKKDQVKVEADNDQLTVYAERKEEKKSESKKKYLSEVYYGSYARTFTLPGPVDEKKVDAKFDNGVLTVMVPKIESTKTKQIPVH
jgi:HSP20 family protein